MEATRKMKEINLESQEPATLRRRYDRDQIARKIGMLLKMYRVQANLHQKDVAEKLV